MNSFVNTMFEKLVQDEDDLVGFIAYGIFELEKLTYIKKFTEEYEREPKDPEVDLYIKSVSDSETIKRYRDIANKKLYKQNNKIKGSKRKNGIGRFLNWVLERVLGNVLYGVIVVIITLALLGFIYIYNESIRMLFS